MGFWDAVSYTGDLLNRITPDTSTLKHTGTVAYRQTSTVATKIGRAVGVQKLTQYWPEDETRVQISRFTTALAKNAGRYAVTEGFKHIPGAAVACKLVSKTMHEVKQETSIDKKKSTSQPETSTQNGELSSQNAVEGVSEKTKIFHSRM